MMMAEHARAAFIQQFRLLDSLHRILCLLWSFYQNCCLCLYCKQLKSHASGDFSAVHSCASGMASMLRLRNNKTLLMNDITTCLIFFPYHIRWCFISQYHAYIHSPTKIVNYHQFAIIHGNMHIDMYILVKFCQLQRIVIQFTCA